MLWLMKEVQPPRAQILIPEVRGKSSSLAAMRQCRELPLLQFRKMRETGEGVPNGHTLSFTLEGIPSPFSLIVRKWRGAKFAAN